MIRALFIAFCRICPRVRGLFWQQCYQFLARFYQEKDWTFMNYGYAAVAGSGESIRLDQADENDRFSIQLYHHVASAVDLAGSDVLEVGSGRGGGADYIKRYLHPRTMVGVDFSESAVAFCNRRYGASGLSFRTGNAEALPFGDGSFDDVVNVESSHCYPSMDLFLSEVNRVLREGGHFLYADFRSRESLDILRDKLRDSGLILVRETDITPNVVAALDLDNERKTARIRRFVHKPLIQPFLEFAGIKGSRTYRKFESRELIYLSFVLQKPAGGTSDRRSIPGIPQR